MQNKKIKNKKVGLILQHPLFSSLSIDEARFLADRTVTETFKPGEYIVTQDELADSIYFIADGICEVQRIVEKNASVRKDIVAIFCPGEVIGLSPRGIYSATGKRTASVVAQTKTITYRLDFNAFNEFLTINPKVDKDLAQNVEILLRMNLIKQSLPFTNITIEKTHWLASKIESIKIPEKKLIFSKNESAKKCYLVKNGEVELFILNDDMSETHIATLTPPNIFGEEALLLNSPYEVCARTTKDSELLSLNQELIDKVAHSETDSIKNIIDLTKVHTSPVRYSYIEECTYEADDKKIFIILKDPKNHTYYRLTDIGYYVWQLLDSKHTLREISVAVNSKFKIFDPQMVAAFILNLEEAGFIEKSVIEKEFKVGNLSILYFLMAKIRKVMDYSITVKNIDKFITNSYNGGIRFLYTPVGQFFVFTIAIVGLIIFVGKFNEHIELLRVTSGKIKLFILSAFIMIFFNACMELSHAYTTKYFGRTVNHFGIGFFWFGPVIVCNTSDMWLASAKQRILVDISGFCFVMFIAGLLSILTLFFQNHYIILLLWVLTVWNYALIIRNSSPFLELNGYYVLMDLLKVNNLRYRSIKWLVDDASLVWKKPSLWKNYKPEITYWIVCIFHILFIEIFLSYLILNYLLYGLFGTNNPFLVFTMIVLVVFFSSFDVWTQIKQEKEKKFVNRG